MIPDFPSVPYPFLSQLPDNIRVSTESAELKQLFTDDIVMVIAEAVCLTQETVKRHVRIGRYWLGELRALDSAVPTDVMSLVKELDIHFPSTWKHISLPTKITPKLAYFLGYLHGDGSVDCNGKRVSFSDEYESQMNNISSVCHQLFHLSGFHKTSFGKKSKKPVHELIVGSRVLNVYLQRVFGMNQGAKENLSIPSIFLEHEEILRYYLSGLFDADGTLPKFPSRCKQFFIDITFKEKEFIEEIRESLRLFGIETYDPYLRVASSPSSETISETWELRIRRHDDIRMFLREIPFIHPDKHRRSQELIALMAP